MAAKKSSLTSSVAAQIKAAAQAALASGKLKPRKPTPIPVIPPAMLQPTGATYAITPPTIPPPNPEDEKQATLEYQRGLLKKLLSRRAELRRESLKLYVPRPSQLEFHKSLAPERVVRGPNRAGKTVCASTEFSWIVTNSHPYRTDLPTSGRAAIVTFPLSHIGRVIYPKLFREGAFKIIPDIATGDWRAYNPDNPSDVARKSQCKPAAALIPPYMLDGKPVWETKSLSIPKYIRLKTGWEIFFFSSEADPPQGDAYDLIFFDEEIVRPSWYEEIVMRLVDKNGVFFWSATPHVGGHTLLDMHERAEEQRNKENPLVTEHFVGFLDNPYIDSKAKYQAAEKFKHNPEAYRVRILGEYSAHGLTVYPEYDRVTHSMKRDELPGGVIPEHWLRFTVTDPGRQHCATLFFALPPPKEGDFCLLYDELYIEKSSAAKYAAGMATKTARQSFFAAIIDRQGSRVRDAAMGYEIEEQYALALKKLGVWNSYEHKSFVWGASDREAGVEAVRDWLAIRPSGKPYLRVLEGSAPNFDYQMKHYYHRKIDGKLTDEVETRKNSHCPDCLRYAAMARIEYRVPKTENLAKQIEEQNIRNLMAQFAPDGGNQSPGHVYLGPSSMSGT